MKKLIFALIVGVAGCECPPDSLQLGKDALDQGDYAVAVYHLTAAIKEDPTAVEPLVQRSRAYRQLRKYDDAIKDASEALKLDPKNADAFRNRGLAQLKLKKLTEGMSDVQQAIKADPGNWMGYSCRAYGHYVKGEYQQVVYDTTNALLLGEIAKPDDLIDVYRLRGFAHLQLKNIDDATKDLTHVMNRKPLERNRLEALLKAPKPKEEKKK